MLIDDHFLIFKNRVAIRVDSLESIFNLKIGLYRKINKTPEDNWEVFVHKINNRFAEFIYIDSIPRNIRNQFNVPDPLDFLTPEIQELIDPIRKQGAKTERLKLQIDTSFSNYLKGRERGNHYFKYIERKFDDSKAKALAGAYGLLEIIATLHSPYTVKEIYSAVTQLYENDPKKYDFTFLLRSNRWFYRYLEGRSHLEIDQVLINGLTNKPSNRRIKCNNTIELVKQYLKHINELSETVITTMVNAIILAFPNTYNAGKIISRATVNNIKRANEVEIKIAREGADYLETVVSTIHRFPTQYPLDRIEIDFTKIHGEMKDEHGVKCNRIICKIIDTCSKATLGLSTGKGESFEVFRQAFCEMLKKTNGRIAAEIVIDRSPAFKSSEFKRIDSFLKGLLGDDYLTVAKKARGKGSIESHWKTLFELYMPEYVGSVGGNIATSKRHRPNREIRLLLKKPEYMREEIEWEQIIRQIDRKYNDVKPNKDELSRIEKFNFMNKPNSVQIDHKHVAYLSWVRRSGTFSGLEFEIQTNYKLSYFGWLNSEVKTDAQKEFVMKNTGKAFDVFHDPDKLNHIYVFEKDSLVYVDSFKCVRSFFGNKVDQRREPQRKRELVSELKARKTLSIEFAEKAKNNSVDKNGNPLGIDLHSYIAEIQNGNKSEDELLQELAFKVLSTVDLKTIDPFKGGPVERKSVKKVRLKDLIKPTRMGR